MDHAAPRHWLSPRRPGDECRSEWRMRPCENWSVDFGSCGRGHSDPSANKSNHWCRSRQVSSACKHRAYVLDLDLSNTLLTLALLTLSLLTLALLTLALLTLASLTLSLLTLTLLTIALLSLAFFPMRTLFQMLILMRPWLKVTEFTDDTVSNTLTFNMLLGDSFHFRKIC